MTNKYRVCYLDISSFQGLSIGAIHFYGELRCDGNRVELIHHLTTEEAIERTKRERADMGSEYRYKRGDKSRGFTTEEQIIDLACRTWHKHFPDADVLILGDNCVAEPQRVLVGPKEFKTQINKWYAECKAFGWYEGNPKKMERISDTFWDYWKEHTV